MPCGRVRMRRKSRFARWVTIFAPKFNNSGSSTSHSPVSDTARAGKQNLPYSWADHVLARRWRRWLDRSQSGSVVDKSGQWTVGSGEYDRRIRAAWLSPRCTSHAPCAMRYTLALSPITVCWNELAETSASVCYGIVELFVNTSSNLSNTGQCVYYALFRAFMYTIIVFTFWLLEIVFVFQVTLRLS